MIKGHLCLMVTPFAADGSLDVDSLQRLGRHLVDGGADGLIVLGSTGEFFSLDDDERQVAVAATVEASGGRVPVIAGVGASGTRQAARFARLAARAGAAAVMVPPPYYAPAFFSSGAGIERHMLEVAEAAAPAEVMLYDGGGGIEIPLDVTAAVSRSAANVTMVKLTVPLPPKVAAIREHTEGRVRVLCGNDALTLYELALGVDGVAIGVGNVVPQAVSDVVHAYLDGGDKDAARAVFYGQVLPVASIALAATQQFIQVFKLGLSRMGLIASDRTRPPLLPLDQPRTEEALAAFEIAGVPCRP